MTLGTGKLFDIKKTGRKRRGQVTEYNKMPTYIKELNLKRFELKTRNTDNKVWLISRYVPILISIVIVYSLNSIVYIVNHC